MELHQEQYKLVITIYGEDDKDYESQPMSWQEVIVQAQAASLVAERMMTRTKQVRGLIRHMNQYSDLYEEGSIKIIKV